MGEESEAQSRPGSWGPPPPVAEIGAILEALADPVRLSIVRALAGGELERSCGAFDLPVSKSTLTHHFGILRDAGLISGRYEGTRKFISLRRADLEAAYPGLLDSILQARRTPAGTATS